MYKCSICGKDYDNVKDRAECEIRCIHAAEEESKRIAKAEAEAARTKPPMKSKPISNLSEPRCRPTMINMDSLMCSGVAVTTPIL